MERTGKTVNFKGRKYGKALLIAIILLCFMTMVSMENIKERNNQNVQALVDRGPISITSDADFSEFPGIGTEEDPYRIENYNITTTSANAIFINGDPNGITKHFVIQNCYLKSAENALQIWNIQTEGITNIINNMCIGEWQGIDIFSSPGANISHNQAINCGDGLYIEMSVNTTIANNMFLNNDGHGIFCAFCESMTIQNNICNNNFEGLGIDSGNNHHIINNTCNENTQNGIFLLLPNSALVTNNICENNSLSGLMTEGMDSSLIMSNLLKYNHNHSLIMEWGSDNEIKYNLMESNAGYGMYLEDTSDVIHHNIFLDNYVNNDSQALDDGNDNVWYDSELQEGNYWSNWMGEDNYNIAGSAESYDYYPLEEMPDIPDLDFGIVKITNIVVDPNPVEVDQYFVISCLIMNTGTINITNISISINQFFFNTEGIICASFDTYEKNYDVLEVGQSISEKWVLKGSRIGSFIMPISVTSANTWQVEEFVEFQIQEDTGTVTEIVTDTTTITITDGTTTTVTEIGTITFSFLFPIMALLLATTAIVIKRKRKLT